jgi:hypothetical protein
MRKPSWMSWIAGVSVWALFYWLFGALFHQTIHRSIPAAMESGLAGGTLTWWFALRRWQKTQRQSMDSPLSNTLGSASSNR